MNISAQLQGTPGIFNKKISKPVNHPSLVDCFEVAVQESLMDDFPEIVLNNYRMRDRGLLEAG